jgi:hypothetical protein
MEMSLERFGAVMLLIGVFCASVYVYMTPEHFLAVTTFLRSRSGVIGLLALLIIMIVLIVAFFAGRANFDD